MCDQTSIARLASGAKAADSEWYYAESSAKQSSISVAMYPGKRRPTQLGQTESMCKSGVSPCRPCWGLSILQNTPTFLPFWIIEKLNSERLRCNSNRISATPSLFKTARRVTGSAGLNIANPSDPESTTAKRAVFGFPLSYRFSGDFLLGRRTVFGQGKLLGSGASN